MTGAATGLRFRGASLFILAGGKGTRMQGVNKALIPLGDRAMAAYAVDLAPHFDDARIVGPRGRGLEALGLPVVPDAVPGLGPLGGLATALSATRTEWIFAVACDMPLLQLGVVRRLWEARGQAPEGVRAVVPRARGEVHPLHAFYHRDLAGAARRLATAQASMQALLLESPVHFIDLGEEEASSTQNVNTPEVLHDLRRHFEPT
ncbi:MAG: molybdenum cofactor guanylyltransferase [Deltaproteobacteria bacterium]|nr:MAG: molybdenum cofactor guanylyltransferase [Deltaproteobacteria bacterium]